jgi:citrate lyase subunit beta / citryl-CoA lyase
LSRPRRTMLFIPGNNPGMIQNAGILGADTIILDLEDAVSLTEKDSARTLVKSAISSVHFYDSEVVVRINPLSTEYSEADIREIAMVKPHAFLVAKATEEDIVNVDNIIGEVERANGFEEGIIKIFPLIETAYGLENIYNIIKASTRVIGVLLGAEDLTADLGIVRTKVGEEIFYARSKVAAACKALKVDAIDTPFTDLEDTEGFIRDIEKAKSIGMTGKAAINPRQIDIIHGVFAPTIEEIDYANRVIDAQKEAELENKGVFSLDGKMVDAPIIARAINILNKSKLYE